MMKSWHETFYYFAPGIDTVPLGDDGVLFRSDTLTVRVEGTISKVLVEELLPLLTGQNSLAAIAIQLPDIDITDLQSHLDNLVHADVLRRRDQALQFQNERMIDPFLRMLDLFGVPESEAIERLQNARVAIFGLESYGAYVAFLLAQCGVRNLVLVDPYPCQIGNLSLIPLSDKTYVGQPRQQVVKNALQFQHDEIEISVGLDKINRDSIFSIAATCDFLVGSFDKGFSAVNHWINQASLEYRKPAIYAESKGHTILLGPLVIPNQTSCYMCYRMRNIACNENFNEAMSYEEFLDKQQQPSLHKRGVLPTTSPYVGSILSLEILKYLLSLTSPSLAGKISFFDTLSLQSVFHTVLQKPDCPACQKKKLNRIHPTFNELKKSATEPNNSLLTIAPKLVSPFVGLIKTLQPVQKDVSEPNLPYIFRTELANHQFLDKDKKEHRICSGKGMTLESAKLSALGEAVERYSGSCLDYDEIIYTCKNDLHEDTIDPRKLVLYAPEQYTTLPYSRYTDSNRMGWVRARSLVNNQLVYVPAIAIYMNYQAQLPEECIFPITSNGLAAGSTLLDAILAATFEVLERDAFIIMWLNQLPCERVDPSQHPDKDIVELCEAYHRRNIDIYLYKLPTDHPCSVFMALGLQTNGTDGPAVVVGLGADLDQCRAARKAILEVGQIRPALRRRMRNLEVRQRMEKLVANPDTVSDLEDHDLLYASRDSLQAFNFLIEQPINQIDWQLSQAWNSVSKMQTMLHWFQAEGCDLLYYNLTPSDISAFGIYTVRVIIPGFQPIHFGRNERRLGGERLFELPCKLGITQNRTKIDQLNPYPHPIS
jgi:ribosomal protein S12 methylthiotransferase accessory factor